MRPNEILALLGINAVLLPIRKGSKAPTRKYWQRATFRTTGEPSYQAALERAHAIGVSLGAASHGLCTIDCDTETFLQEMLRLNPALQSTLRTTAKRGANLWFILTGTPPKSRKLKFLGEAAGEFRSTGNQTIIAGSHPDGLTYRVVVDSAPVRIQFEDLRWPPEALAPHATNSSQSPPLSPYSTGSPSSPPSPESPRSLPLHPLHNFQGRLKAREQAKLLFDRNLPLRRLYRKYVEKRSTPRQGSRNTDLVAMITFLFRAVGRKQVIALVRAFYELNQDIFRDPFEQHMHEADAHLQACDRTWRSELTEYERAFVDHLPEVYVEAFRICRDLAAHESPESPRGRFFLSMGDLGDRLGLHPPDASRILRAFESEGCIAVERLGTRHTKGERGKATRYIWILGIPRPPDLEFRPE